MIKFSASLKRNQDQCFEKPLVFQLIVPCLASGHSKPLIQNMEPFWGIDRLFLFGGAERLKEKNATEDLHLLKEELIFLSTLKIINFKISIIGSFLRVQPCLVGLETVAAGRIQI